MPTRSRTTFKKRQKEMARQEKQRDKQARRMERKAGSAGSGPEIADRSTLDEFGLPLDASPNREDEEETEE